jgi:hypothetical protein
MPLYSMGWGSVLEVEVLFSFISTSFSLYFLPFIHLPRPNSKARKGRRDEYHFVFPVAVPLYLYLNAISSQLKKLK